MRLKTIRSPGPTAPWRRLAGPPRRATTSQPLVCPQPLVCLCSLVCLGLLVSLGLPAGADEIRAARSVHLGYPGAGGSAFYNELTVEQSVPGSYFMANGFRHGYFGIQELAQGRKVVIFSVWDPTAGDDPNAVPESRRVEILHKDEQVLAKRFGGEGTGGQSFYQYDWKPGVTYRFLVTARVDGQKTAFAAHFYLPEAKRWKHLVTFRTHTGGESLRGLYSFVEDFRRDGRSAAETRRAQFGNGWLQAADGSWSELSTARFTASGASWEAKETIDAGVTGQRFYLQTGGGTTRSAELGAQFRRPATTRPLDLPPLEPPKGGAAGP